MHIHSCLSPCADNDMTPNNIAGMAALKGLNILALTDHNSCKNCPAFFEACRTYGIIPVAGMELSTAEDIHIICLFESLDKAMAFDAEIEKHMPSIANRPEIFGDQLILDGNDEVVGEEKRLLISATDLWLGEAIALAKSFGAHVHPAHIDRESNGIISILGDLPIDYDFEFLEFNDHSNIPHIREKYPNTADKQTVVSSDAHHLWDISEADHCFEIDDEPYSSALVRKRLFEILKGASV